MKHTVQRTENKTMRSYRYVQYNEGGGDIANWGKKMKGKHFKKRELKWQTKSGQAVTLLTCIGEVPGSNLDQDIDDPERPSRSFPQCVQANTGILPEVRPISFLPFSSLLLAGLQVLKVDTMKSSET
jgi:hypothetical protein